MPRYVALLRGINVGEHRVKMDRLRGLFEEVAVEDVSTFIASGNVIFTDDGRSTDELTARIEEHLETELGYGVATFLRTVDRLAEVADVAWPDALGGPDAPEGADDGDAPAGSHYVVFLRAPADADLRASLSALESDYDVFRYDGDEVHWLLRGKMSESPLFGGALEKAIRGVPNTMRNMTSVRRMAAKYGS